MQNEKVSQYIEKQNELAKPILEYLRNFMHSCGLELQEEVKWGMPFFMYKGKVLCNIAGFKQHCAFGFWNAFLMEEAFDLLQTGKEKTAMGNLGKITTIEDLPAPDLFKALVLKSAALIDEGKPVVQKRVTEKKELQMPDILKIELEKEAELLQYFNSLSYSHKKEYIEYITEAKRAETQIKRVEKTLELLANKNSLHGKYAKK